MVDSLSQHRLHGSGYSCVLPRLSLPSYRDYAAQFVHRKFTHYHPPAHDCRRENSKWHHDPHHWPPYLLTFGLQHCHEDKETLHFKSTKGSFDKKAGDRQKRTPSKMLFAVGVEGSKDGQFRFPRGISATLDGDLVVADTENHRVQLFNSHTTHKASIGGVQGSKTGQFDCPSGVAVLPNGNVAIADRGNRRIQIMRPKGHVRFIFTTKGHPCALASDNKFNILAGTTERQIEVYRKGGKFLRAFPLRGASDCTAIHLASNNKEQLLVCDTAMGTVGAYAYSGAPLWEFRPPAASPGLAIVPVGVALTASGDLVVGDALNHTINLYSGETGQLIEMLLGPTDDLGSIQGLALTPEGHVAVVEFSVKGMHCLKVFRFLDCDCHRNRPMSAKRGYSTPIPK